MPGVKRGGRRRAPERQPVTARAVRRGSRPGKPLPDPELDAIAVEEPLEIRLGRRALAVTMRTPGLEHEMVLGFLLAEGLITAGADVDIRTREGQNIVQVRGLGTSARSARRGTVTTSACGVCGRLTISDLLARIRPVPRPPAIPLRQVARAPEVLRASQSAFDRTGALHAAGALGSDGSLLAFAEDVGRHNAVDKVVGLLLRAGTLRSASILAVSGRASFEIVQKAAAAGIPCVAAVGAPSSLAIDLAEAAGICLAGFVRADRLNIYTHPDSLRA